MADFTTLRKTKWFINIPSGNPGSIVTARYMGVDASGNQDPLAGGINGPKKNTDYQVMLLSAKDKLLAPCPDFCNGSEGMRTNATDRAVILANKEIANKSRP